MSRSIELDFLKSREQDAFNRKQAAYQRYIDMRNRCNEAYDEMQSAWNERSSAAEVMTHEYENMRSTKEHYKQVWDEYGHIRDRNNYEIERLRAEADLEHSQMKDCFERASDCYEFGDKSEAPYWSQQGHEHKERRDDINSRVSELCQEVKSAKQNAEWRAPKTDFSAFHRAKDAFDQAKSRHMSAEEKFKRLKEKRDFLKSEFDSLHAEHIRLKEEFSRKLDEIKTTNRRERDRTLDKAGIRHSERSDAKIVKKDDGTTQIYHGGIGKGDGLGHGHTTLDQFGNKIYDRQAFSEHGQQNYINDQDNKALAIGTDYYDGKPAKVRFRNDGKMDVFYVNYGNEPDGVGHGHVVVRDDSVIYDRDMWQDKRQGQYLIDESKDDHTRI